MSRRPKRPPLILDRTPQREQLVANVEDAMRRLAAKGYAPPYRSIYVSDDTAKACGLGPLGMARDPGDPPRCLGLPIYRATDGRNRIYTRNGCATTIRRIQALTTTRPDAGDTGDK